MQQKLVVDCLSHFFYASFNTTLRLNILRAFLDKNERRCYFRAYVLELEYSAVSLCSTSGVI